MELDPFYVRGITMFSLISKVEKDRKGKKRKTKGEKTERQTDFKTYQYQEL
jgi:hypothetical protein